MFEPIISLENARAVLFSRMQGFSDALGQCQKVWNNQLAFTQRTLSSSARAHVLNDYWYYYASAIFAGDSSVVFSTEQRQRHIVIDERVIMRFKLLDGRLCSSNYPTDHALDWNRQMPLKGLPTVARLCFGYRMDITGTNVKDAFVTLPRTTINEWVWQTSGEPIDTYGFQLPLSEKDLSNQMVYWYDNFLLGD